MWTVAAAWGLCEWTARRRRRDLARFADARLLPQLAAQVNEAARRAKSTLLVATLLLTVVAMAGPQWGFRWQEVRHRGADILIALDVSKSMLAEDVKPNRLARAKLAIRDMIPLLQGDRIGLIAFAGTSFLQCPLTVDYDAFLLVLDDLSPETIPRGGTSLASAIDTGLEALRGSASGSRAMILITDGEDQRGDARAAARRAAEAGVTIHCVGIGTPEGELIPITDDQGHPTFLKDREGRTVKSRLDEATLQAIARETGGSYVRATGASFGLDRLYRERIASLSKQEFETRMERQREERFQWPLAAAWLILLIETMVGERRRSSEPCPVETRSEPATVAA